MEKLFSINGAFVSDITLLNAKNGDAKSLELVLESSRQQARGVINYFQKSLNEYSMSDLSHTCNLVAYECLRGFNPDSGCPFSAYFIKALKNRFLNMVSYSSRIVSIDAGWDSEGNEDYEVMDIEDDSDSSVSCAEDRQYADALLSALFDGTPDVTASEKRVLRLMLEFLGNGVSPTDQMLAERLGVSHQAVSKAKNKAFRKFRETGARLRRQWNEAV